MKTTIQYKNSPAPRFDAIEDIKDYLDSAERWDTLLAYVRATKSCAQVAITCSFIGIEGFPVIALYELVYGQGTWVEPDFVDE